MDDEKALVSREKTEEFLANGLEDLSSEAKESLLRMAIESNIRVNEKNQLDAIKSQNADSDFERHMNAVRQFDNRVGKGINHIRTDIDTASGHIRMDSNSSRCYVATATYQNMFHPNVVILRDYRDRFLRKTWYGRAFIVFYYSIGKKLSFFPEHFIFIRKVSRRFLDSIVFKIVKKHYGSFIK